MIHNCLCKGWYLLVHLSLSLLLHPLHSGSSAFAWDFCYHVCLLTRVDCTYFLNSKLCFLDPRIFSLKFRSLTSICYFCRDLDTQACEFITCCYLCMCLFTALSHPHEHWQLQELLGNPLSLTECYPACVILLGQPAWRPKTNWNNISCILCWTTKTNLLQFTDNSMLAVPSTYSLSIGETAPVPRPWSIISSSINAAACVQAVKAGVVLVPFATDRKSVV